MKRWLGLVLGIGVLLLGWSTFRPASAGSNRCGLDATKVKVLARGGAGKAFIAVDDLGEFAYLDPATNATITPLRPFFTILGEPGAVEWDGPSRTAHFRYATHELTLQVALGGEGVTTQLDGHPYPLQAYLCDGHLHAPLRDVTNALGLELRWYHQEQMAVIDPVWVTGVEPPVQAPTTSPKPARPTACSAAEQLAWGDLLLRPLNAWNRTVQRTACALII